MKQKLKLVHFLLLFPFKLSTTAVVMDDNCTTKLLYNTGDELFFLYIYARTHYFVRPLMEYDMCLLCLNVKVLFHVPLTNENRPIDELLFLPSHYEGLGGPLLSTS